jgi:arsenate reductase (thioredoxin)
MEKKRVLILCTGNSCRSIMAEALINARMGPCIVAESSGVAASGKVNPDAEALLRAHGLWRNSYHSKEIGEVLDRSYDLIVTVCDNAKESCPVFPKAVKTLHVGFEDPSGKPMEAYAHTLELIEAKLLPAVEKALNEA